MSQLDKLASIVLRIASRTAALHAQGRSGSASELLAESGHVSTGTAEREAKRAEIAESLPSLGAVLIARVVSGEHLDIVARTTGRLADEQRTHLDTVALTHAASKTSPDEFARAARQLVDDAKQDWGLGRAIEERQSSELKMWRDPKTGMGRLLGCFDPERYSAFLAQINAETASLAASRSTERGVVTKDEFLAMDALVSLIAKGTGTIGRSSVSVHVDADTAINGPHTESLRETDCGHQLPPETIQRFLCDSVVQPAVMSDGVAMKLGRKYRTASENQWAALRAMYATCAWHACTTQVNWCQAHVSRFARTSLSSPGLRNAHRWTSTITRSTKAIGTYTWAPIGR